MKKIGSLGESSLHADLKAIFASPGDLIEYEVMGSVVDIFKHHEIVEIQTGNFGKLKTKLAKLAQILPVRVVLPLAAERFIIRIDKGGNKISRRRSPKKARYEDLFAQIIHLGPWIIGKPIILEVVMIRDEVIWNDDGLGSWRRNGWSIADRTLLDILDRREFQSIKDYATLLPSTLPNQFSVKQLAEHANIALRLAGQMMYFLMQIHAVDRLRKEGRAYIYRRIE